jgi:Calcineurin-like phosphoesterase
MGDTMHSVVNKHDFVQSSLDQLTNNLNENSDEIRSAVAAAIGSSDPQAIESARSDLASHFGSIRDMAANEPSHGDVDYVSRFNFVGLYQSVLAKVFSRVPELQGYGDGNPIWFVTLVEEGVYKLGGFFKNIYKDVHGQKEPLLQSILKEWKGLQFEKAPYPAGTPKTIQLPPNAIVALLADWGGDNPAARHIASVTKKQKPNIVIHLGDIYYGGIKSECLTFLQLWPFQTNIQHPEIGVPSGSSFALNGNHEMYSGGESYFNVVLQAFGQPQPFFCLENVRWRIIGLDTAYNGGRLKPNDASDPITAQWDWLIEILKKRDGKKNILLTHHQPVSAHSAEFGDSAPLRSDIMALLGAEGVGQDAIFGWFFGHEHRCAIYKDSETSFNARLIGNGCIPHEVQTEQEADPGCTPILKVNRRQTDPDSGAAASMFALLNFSDKSPELLIEYIDEDNVTWGSEVWNAEKGRLGGDGFEETDFDQKLKS